ncbi:MAG: hypothetical protein LBQ79_04140 [Deltaproteobacteria bacterium]|jgi:hypothetical protein|nr:hypothetical protein [Deltaproteobacteria bacterium]
MLNLTTPVGGLNIKSGSLYGGTLAGGFKHKIESSTLKIETPGLGAEASGAREAAESKGALARNFAASLLANLVAADRLAEERNRHTDEENKLLVKAVTDFVDETKSLFGDDEANRLMANLLLATDGAVTESRIAVSVTEFLGKIKDTAMATFSAQGSNQEALDKASGLLEKVSDAVGILNDGPRGYEGTPLAGALNDYFGKDRTEDQRKSFTLDLDWLSRAEQAGAAAAAASGQELTVLKGEIGEGAVAAAAEYLTNELAAAEAAKILTELKEDEDVLEAVDRVRERLAEMDRAAQAAAGESAAASAAAVAVAAADVAEPAVGGYTVSESVARAAVQGTVKGAAESASRRDIFDEYLLKSMTQEINRAVREDERLAERLRNLASLKMGVDLLSSTSITVGGWPGLGIVHTTGFSVSVGWKREFSVSVDSEGRIETGMSESVSVSASFTSSTSVGFGVGLGAGLVTGYGTALAAAATLDLAKTLEHSYSSGRSGTNRSTSLTSKSFLLSKHV